MDIEEKTVRVIKKLTQQNISTSSEIYQAYVQKTVIYIVFIKEGQISTVK